MSLRQLDYGVLMLILNTYIGRLERLDYSNPRIRDKLYRTTFGQATAVTIFQSTQAYIDECKTEYGVFSHETEIWSMGSPCVGLVF